MIPPHAGRISGINLLIQLKIKRFEIRQLFRDLLSEKKRWDLYQQAQYIGILEKTLEPEVIENQSLQLENIENMQYFLELEISGKNTGYRFVRCLFLHRISGIFPGFNPSPECRCIMITVL